MATLSSTLVRRPIDWPTPTDKADLASFAGLHDVGNRKSTLESVRRGMEASSILIQLCLCDQ